MAIKFAKAKGDYTSFGGLKLFEQVFRIAKLRESVRESMPTGPRTTVRKSFNKFMALVYGMVIGNDCIDDMDRVTQDPVFSALCAQKTYTAQSYGDFLREFGSLHIRKLADALRENAFRIRRLAFPKDWDLIIDIDSSSHEQHGKKIEGASFNYANVWSLDTLNAYDQYGILYATDVRPGSTFTSNGAAHMIRHIFSGAPKKFNRFLRGDSGYCNFEVMNTCIDYNVDFVLAMRANMFEPLLKKINWWKWKESKHTKFRDGRIAEIAVAPYYQPGVKRSLRVVVIRAKKQQPGLFGELYDYRAWITSMGEHQMGNEEVIDFYKKRGNAENFIKEGKNAFDLHHFPCQKLSANKVWAFMAAFAHNAMRCVASVLNPRRLHYAKRIRFQMIYLGGHVVKKSRNWIIRLSNHHYEEVQNWQCRIQNLLTPG